jgi:hypothetical protein
MVTPTELRARVAATYDLLGLPSWPDPHPGGAPAHDEEYSRVTDPERYRVVPARGRAWAARLAELPGVRVEPVDHGVRLTSSRPETLPLLLLERDMWPDGRQTWPAVLWISVVRPEIVVDRQPDCGCDACDSGSEDLLTAVDRAVGAVVGGPFVALRGAGWHAMWHPDGGSSGGTDGVFPDHARLMDLCRRLADGAKARLPDGAEAFVGRGWL